MTQCEIGHYVHRRCQNSWPLFLHLTVWNFFFVFFYPILSWLTQRWMDIYAKFELGATLISPAPTSWDIPRLLFWCFIFCLFSFYAYWGLHVLLCLLVQIEWLVLVFCYVCPKRCSSLHCTWQIQWNRLSVCRVYDKVFLLVFATSYCMIWTDTCRV